MTIVARSGRHGKPASKDIWLLMTIKLNYRIEALNVNYWWHRGHAALDVCHATSSGPSILWSRSLPFSDMTYPEPEN